MTSIAIADVLDDPTPEAFRFNWHNRDSREVEGQDSSAICFTIETIHGKDFYKPTSEKARVLSDLAGFRELTARDMLHIAKLGITIVVTRSVR